MERKKSSLVMNLPPPSDLCQIQELHTDVQAIFRRHGIDTIQKLSELNYDGFSDPHLSRQHIQEAIHLAKLHMTMNMISFPVVHHQQQQQRPTIQHIPSFFAAPAMIPPLPPSSAAATASSSSGLFGTPMTALPTMLDDHEKEMAPPPPSPQQDVKIGILPWSVLRKKQPTLFQLTLEFLKHHCTGKKDRKIARLMEEEQQQDLRVVVIYFLPSHFGAAAPDNIMDVKEVLFFCVLRRLREDCAQLSHITPLKSELLGKLIDRLKHSSLKLMSVHIQI
jgi:hypothetical protein